MTFLRTDEAVLVDSFGEEWAQPMPIFQCDGCDAEMPAHAGCIDGARGLHWCPECAFRLRKIGHDDLKEWAHWGLYWSGHRTTFDRDGEIEMVPIRKERRKGNPLRVPGLPSSKRFAILQRDKFRCRYCGATPDNIVLHVDHVIARAHGGGDESTNLVTACSDCNQGKGTYRLRLCVPGAAT